MTPLPKNHRCIKQAKDIYELMPILHSQKSIYFVPLARVMPSRFFMCWAWMNNQAIVNHALAGNFWEVINKEDISRNRIREKVLEASIEIAPPGFQNSILFFN